MKDKFKVIKETIKENFILLLGVGLFTYCLFNFSSDKYCDTEGGLVIPSIGQSSCINPETSYYYDSLTLILLTVGAILIAIGLLKIKKEGARNKKT